MTTKIKKRFVAGAKCPKCGAKDSILLFKENGIETVECTDCDYREQQTDIKVTEKPRAPSLGCLNPTRLIFMKRQTHAGKVCKRFY